MRVGTESPNDIRANVVKIFKFLKNVHAVSVPDRSQLYTNVKTQLLYNLCIRNE